MQKIKITLAPYKSPYFPIVARYTLNGVKYSTVHEDADSARRYYEGRFLSVHFTTREA